MRFDVMFNISKKGFDAIFNGIQCVTDPGGGILPTLTSPGTEADLLEGKELIDGDGKVINGAMPNNGSVRRFLDVNTTSYNIPEGYHDGNGRVYINAVTRTYTPTKNGGFLEPVTGAVFGKVIVNGIPDKYQDVTGVTAKASDVLPGKVFVDATGAVVEGAIPIKTEEDLIAKNAVVTVPSGYYAEQVSKQIQNGELGAPSIKVMLLGDGYAIQARSEVATEGYLSSIFGRYSTVGNLQSKTVTPSSNAQAITADDDYIALHDVQVVGDANLLPENIVKGVSIFNVAGSYEPPALKASDDGEGNVVLSGVSATVNADTGEVTIV